MTKLVKYGINIPLFMNFISMETPEIDYNSLDVKEIATDSSVGSSIEHTSFHYDVLGSTLEINGILFVVLGLEPFSDESISSANEIGAVICIQKDQKKAVAVVVLGGVAILTKIRVGEKIIVGSTVIAGALRNLEYLPQVDKETGVYVDDDDEEWMSLNSLSMRLKISPQYIKKFITDSFAILGRDRTGHIVRLINVSAIRSATEEFRSLRRVGADGVYRDSDGMEWMPITSLATRLKTTKETLKNERNNLIPISGRDQVGKVVDLYDVEAARRALQNFLLLPRVDETGVYRDGEDREWMPLEQLAFLLQSTEPTLKKYLPHTIATISGRTRGNTVTDLFDVAAVRSATHDFLSLPRTDERGMYRDADGREWMPLKRMAKNLAIDYGKLRIVSQSISCIQGRTYNGRPTTLYDVDAICIATNEYRSLPCVNENGVYQDAEKITWMTLRSLAVLIIINTGILKSLLEKEIPIIGRASNGQIANLYRVDIARRIASDFLSLPQADKTGIYHDGSGNEWMLISSLPSRFQIEWRIVKKNASNILSIPGRDSSGHRTLLYCVESATKILTASSE